MRNFLVSINEILTTEKKPSVETVTFDFFHFVRSFRSFFQLFDIAPSQSHSLFSMYIVRFLTERSFRETFQSVISFAQ